MKEGLHTVATKTDGSTYVCRDHEESERVLAESLGTTVEGLVFGLVCLRASGLDSRACFEVLAKIAAKNGVALRLVEEIPTDG